jgi:hypothetical protein
MNDILHSLDAAVTETADPPADLLERIIATPVEPVRRSRRRLLIPAAAAALTLGATGVALSGGIGGGQAYASWTPVPAALTKAEIGLVGPKCVEKLGSPRMDLKRADLVLAERRGEYVAMLYHTADPEMSGFCLAHNPPGSKDVDDVRTGSAGGSGPATVATRRGFTQGGLADFTDWSLTSGTVGQEVTAVTVHTTRKQPVEATVRDGRYVVWWPGPAIDRKDQHDLFSFDLTLRDGTVIHHAKPELPR